VRYRAQRDNKTRRIVDFRRFALYGMRQLRSNSAKPLTLARESETIAALDFDAATKQP